MSQSATAPMGKLTLGYVLSLLKDDEVLSVEDVERVTIASAIPGASNVHPFQRIADSGVVNQRTGRTFDQESLAEYIAPKVGLEYRLIDPMKVDVASVAEVVSYAYASRYNILALEVMPAVVTFATAEPFEQEWEAELAHILKRDIRRVLASPDAISRYATEFYSLAKSVSGARKKQQHAGGQTSSVQNLEQLMDLGRRGKLDANDQHVVNIVDWLLQYAFEQRAGDIHLEPRREQSVVRFRIDGVLHEVYQVPTEVMGAVTSRIKILGRMDVAEKRRPQDGRLKTRDPQGNEVELRLSTMPTVFGEKLVMRVFDPEVRVQDAKALGFSPRELQQWEQMLSQPHGIILVTGPTGSGKTTTLYSTLRQLAKPEINICTIEDPIESVDPALNQMQVQHGIDLDFASGIRTLLRQDPDIIMIGEIRDLETAQMATQAALTGHLVFSTLHTNDAPSAVTRLLELGVPHYLINATLVGVLAQRLVRTLCPHCKKATQVDAARWEELIRPWQAAAPEQIYEPVGCLECRNTGFLGRIGIYETLTFGRDIKRHVHADADVNGLRKAAYQAGMRPLRISGVQKVASGMTTIDEIYKVAPAPLDEM